MKLRVFLSSPGDVADERGLARQVLARLPQEAQFRGRVLIEEVSWDNPAAPVPLAAQLTPQEAINQGRPKPADCDVVLVILWARMGTPLPPEYTKPDGSRFESGTEWEYLDAVGEAERHGNGTPLVLVYRRTEPVLLDRKAADFAERVDQGERVDRFFDGFRAPDGSLRRSYHEYVAPADFGTLLERHLRDLLWRRLDSAGMAPRDPAATPDDADAAAPRWQESPYPGLRAFTSSEAPVFFGRGRETDDLVGRFTRDDARFLVVIGASGSGKSSLVAAGLLPRLAAGAVQGQGWTWVRCTPGYAGDDPFLALAVALDRAFPKPGWKPPALARRLEGAAGATLAEVVHQALADHPPSAELVLFIDQLEELFTLTAERYRKPFVDLIVAAASTPRLRTVATLRADFYSHCTQWEPLVGVLRDGGSYPLGLPGPQALAEMITRPAQAAGLEFDDGLVDRILQETGTGPGALALMEFLLSKLYEHRTGRRLTVAAYDTLQGVAGVVEERAEAAVREPVGSVDEAAVAALFRAVVTVDPQTGNPVRRRAALADLEAIRPLVDRLVAARLLVTGQDGTVEVAHEAVLLHWKRLVAWVDEHRELILWQRRMEDDVAVWKQMPQDPGTLLRGVRLAEGERWLAAGAGQLSQDEQAFVEASGAARDRELAEKRSQLSAQRWRRRGLAVVAAGLLLTLGFFGPRWVEQYRMSQPIPPEMVAIPPGEFEMGSPGEGPAAEDAEDDERPPHTVRFAKAFLIGKYEVTAEEYERCTTAGACPRGGGNGREPASVVSWDEARKYARWLSEKTGARCRLPTESEWEYAARGRATEPGEEPTRFWWGNYVEPERRHANCDGCGEGAGGEVAKVGTFPANPFGLHDTAGNVWEWVQDCYHESYEDAPEDGQAWEDQQEACRLRVIRGGSWDTGPLWMRSAVRYGGEPGDRSDTLGFRLAQDLP